MIYHWLVHHGWLGNSALAWFIAGAAALFGFIVVRSVALYVRVRLEKLAERRHRRSLYVAAAVAAATRGWLLLLIAIAIALDFLHLGASASRGLNLATYALIGVQIALWVTTLIVAWIERTTTRNDGQAVNQVMVGVLTWFVQFVVWVTLLLALLNAGGVPITSFIASLGVGGVAVALAAQTVLGDLFASISIGLDKPFVVGEFIAFGEDLGTVIKVGIKSTRVQSLSGEELAVSNSELLKNLLHNYSRMRQRRIVFGFCLPFDTPRSAIPAALARVRQFIEAEDHTRFDRGHLKGFGEYGLEFEFVYYVLDPSYNLYMDIQQRINLAMLAAWKELEIEFAVPVRQIHRPPAGGTPVIRGPVDETDTTP